MGNDYLRRQITQHRKQLTKEPRKTSRIGKKKANTMNRAEKVEYGSHDYRNHPKLVTFDDCLYKLMGELHYARHALYEYKNASPEMNSLTTASPEINSPTTLYQYVKPTELFDSLSDNMYKLACEIHDVREELLHRVEHWTKKTRYPITTSSSEDGSEDNTASYNNLPDFQDTKADTASCDKLPDSDFQGEMSDPSESYDSNDSETAKGSNETITEAESEARVIAWISRQREKAKGKGEKRSQRIA